MTYQPPMASEPTPYQSPEPGQPYPGAPTLIPPPQPPQPKKPNWLIVGLAGAGALLVSGIAFATSAASTDIDQPSRPAVEQDREVSEAPVVNEPAPEPEPEPIEPEEPELTVSQEQAIGTAEDYLAYTAFSRSGLVDQLEYEGFTTEEAEFAVDYLDVNWKEQAARMAQQYLDYSHFSRQGLIDQLEYEGFTREQAEYGVDQAGL